MQLPKDLSVEEFDERYRSRPDEWKGAVEETCAKHGISSKDFSPFADGSNLIASVANDTVVKIFPPFHRHQWESEWRVLRCLWDHGLSIPIPKLIAHGEREDHWTYVILSKVPGVTLESVWSKLDQNQKSGLMREIGTLMALVHAVPVAELHDLAPEWKGFLNEQVERCKARHQRLGMADWFLNEVGPFVAQSFSTLPNENHVILTGEYTPFNLLVDQLDGVWRITGMIDFGDAMVGLREYDFLGPLLFLGGGDAGLIKSLFEAYRYGNPCIDRTLRKRLMLLAILHRYSHLKLQIRIPGWENRVKSLLELENLIFDRATQRPN